MWDCTVCTTINHDECTIHTSTLFPEQIPGFTLGESIKLRTFRLFQEDVHVKVILSIPETLT
jgi:hypothetical protein